MQILVRLLAGNRYPRCRYLAWNSCAEKQQKRTSRAGQTLSTHYPSFRFSRTPFVPRVRLGLTYSPKRSKATDVVCRFVRWNGKILWSSQRCGPMPCLVRQTLQGNSVRAWLLIEFVLRQRLRDWFNSAQILSHRDCSSIPKHAGPRPKFGTCGYGFSKSVHGQYPSWKAIVPPLWHHRRTFWKPRQQTALKPTQTYNVLSSRRNISAVALHYDFRQRP